MTDEQLTRTAYHEAGHAVLQIALGLGCKGVSIVADYNEGTLGTATHGGEWGNPAQSFNEPDDDVATLRSFAEDAFLLRHAISLYAGAEAVRHWKPRRKSWQAGADSDYRTAVDRINEITPDAESIDLLFKYAKRRCKVLVENYWPEITAVAEQLVKHRSISGDQAQDTFNKSLSLRCGRRMCW